MFIINRDAVVLKGKKPVVDWINSIDPENPVSLDDLREDSTVILLPPCNGKEEALFIVESNYEALFFGEIEGWIADDSMWPEGVTLETFREWFDVEYHSMIFDAVEEDIEKEE